MILFTVLVIVALLFIIGSVIGLIASGAAFLIVFGDVIVCILLIALIIRHIVKKHRK